MLYVHAVYVTDRWPNWKMYIGAFLASCSYYAVTYVFSYRLGLDVPGWLETVFPGEIRSEVFGGYDGGSGLAGEYATTLFALAAVAMVAIELRSWQRAGAVLVLFFSVLFVVSSTSRSAAIGLAIVAVGIIGVASQAGRRRASRALAILAGLAVSLVWLSSWSGLSFLSEKFGDWSAVGADGHLSADEATRRPYHTLPEIVAASGLCGAGPLHAEAMLGSNLVSHCLVVNWIATIGLVGMSVQLAFLVLIGRDVWKAARRCVGEEKAIALGLGALLLALAENQFFHSYEQTSASMLRMWFLYAMAAVLANRVDASERAAEESRRAVRRTCGRGRAGAPVAAKRGLRPVNSQHQ